METKHLGVMGMATGVALALASGDAQAAAAQFTALPVDALAVTFFKSLTNVWIPIIAMLALIGLTLNMFVGFMQIGARVVGFIFGVSLLAGGLPLLAKLFGNDLVTALIL
jgi:hypothetical protein